MAPGSLAQRPRKTKVRVLPMWVPWDNEGKGGLRFVGADTSHTADVRDSQGGAAVPYYEAKGFIPMRMFTPEMNKALVAAAKAAKAEAEKTGGAVPGWVALAESVSGDADAA